MTEPDNPWLGISLADYEAHMMSPSVAQAQMLGHALDFAVSELRPRSVALLGAAGGNGLERILRSSVSRLVAVDINWSFLETCEARFATCFRKFEVICENLASATPRFRPVRMCFAGLIAEYVPIAALARYAAGAVAPEGRLVSVLQLPSIETQTVNPSAFMQVCGLHGLFRHVDPEELTLALVRQGYFADVRLDYSLVAGGKRFCRLIATRTRRGPNASADFRDSPSFDVV